MSAFLRRPSYNSNPAQAHSSYSYEFAEDDPKTNNGRSRDWPSRYCIALTSRPGERYAIQIYAPARLYLSMETKEELASRKPFNTEQRGQRCILTCTVQTMTTVAPELIRSLLSHGTH